MIGNAFGPQFTTNDTIGCGVNFVDNSCFYTKNGVLLGTAFRNLMPNLFPCVGMRTCGEIVEVRKILMLSEFFDVLNLC